MHTEERRNALPMYMTFLLVLLLLAWPVGFIIGLIINIPKIPKMAREMYPGMGAFMQIQEESLEYDQEECEEEFVEEELPFCQLFTVGPDMSLLIDHVEMCPDETAFIRVVDDEGYTPLYKRKVRRDKHSGRFIQFNGTNHYLDDKKTQPIITRKDK